jgi:voltage-gated potassium channel
MLLNQQRVMTILNKGNGGDRLSRGCDLFLSLLIILNLLAVCLESVESINNLYHRQLVIFEIVSVSIFMLEYSLRIWSVAADRESPATTASGRRYRYIFSFTGIIDLLAILPSILPLLLGGIDLRWLRVLRLARLLKISHYSSALEDLFSAIYEERRSFFAALYLMGIALFLSSSLMYLAEYEAQPEKFASIPQTMWWALITLTTVGYGDVYPVTPLGQAIGAFTALLGVCTVALLTGIVASAFSNQMARRETIFEAEIAAALSDGVVTEDEQAQIEELRERFKITEEHARAVFALIDDQPRN